MPQAMEIWNAAAAEAAMDVTLLAQNPVGPMGADFGKASPIGLLVIVLLLVVILLIGVDLTRRMKRMRRRRAFAEEHGMDPFDIEGIDRAMADHESSGGLDGEAIVEDRFSGEPELRERRSKD
ncbi:hypothetical protein [Corynebacterium xerosis]|uniref:Uncharacterized protein n=1 Tax=Corynebacterium xerosis TaxID=1725 RepID=A0ABV3UVU5_9CORY|nr:hypothetical protein [Corynebacterium xerosis]HJG57923.1 hypothetical protein [Corynebacterium xerosis]